jgi:gluconate 5-dehydrogenase
VSGFDLAGRTALVTGSTRGIGLALAQALAEAGATVVVNGRAAGAVDAVARNLGGIPAPFDVTDANAVAAAVSALPPVDVLVNNAGTTVRRPLLATEPEEWRHVLETNLTAAFVVARTVVPGMIARGSGKIINIGSVAGEVARPTTGAYAAAKGGLRALTRTMCVEWAGAGIQANALAPGYVRTDLTAPLQADAGFTRWLEQRVPVGRWAEPGELGGAVVFLASPASDFVNGHVLVVDGGLTAAL